MNQFLERIGVDRGLMMLSAGLVFFLLVLLLIGWIWAARLPPAPTVLPDPQVLAPTLVILPEPISVVPPGGEVVRPSNGEESTVEAEGDADFVGRLDLDQLDTIVARPLFWASRRPLEEVEMDSAPVNASAGDDEDLSDVQLIGVYRAGPNSGVIVLVDGVRERVRLNGLIKGWQLNALEANSASFVDQSGREQTVQLEHANSAQYTATADKKAESSGSSRNRRSPR